MSDQRFNEHIKTVCEVAGLTQKVHGGLVEKTFKKYGEFPKWKLVSSHVGRRSYASNNYGIIPTPVLMLMTGHKTEAMFLEYVGKPALEQSELLDKYTL